MEAKNIDVEIRCLSNMIFRYIESNMSRIMPPDISRSNAWILGYIDNHKDSDVFQKDLEDEFGVTRSTVSKVVELLVKKGYIRRESVNYDARLKKLTLTPKAKEVAAIMSEDAKSTEDMLTDGFTPEELAEFRTYISRIRNNLFNARKDGFYSGADCPKPACAFQKEDFND